MENLCVFSADDLEMIDKLYWFYDDDLKDWSEKHNVKLPRLSSMRGQIIALLTDKKNQDKVFTRESLELFARKFGLESNDIIQHVNKTDQWGLVHKTEKRKYYSIPRPFEYCPCHVNKRMKFSSLVDEKEKEQHVERVKSYLKKYYIDVPACQWDLGHKNPHISDNSVNNLVIQPPLQRAFRDLYKFDDNGMKFCPTVEEIKRNSSKYYSNEELKELIIHFQDVLVY
jgi:predicted transcriptional regulator